MSATVVTCYYKFKSKHSAEDYEKWINLFLPNINCNLIIFTSPDLKDLLLNARRSYPNNTFIICQKFEDLELNRKYIDKWDYQYSIDPQKAPEHKKRTKECFILWNSKLLFLKKSIELNPFNSDKFVWTDIGCLRNSNNINLLFNYPVYEKISTGKIDITLLCTINNLYQEFFINEIHFSGAMFGSDSNTILIFCELFYKYFDNFINQNKFIGCDQQTISAVYNKHRELFNPIKPERYWVDVWFFLWQYYT